MNVVYLHGFASGPNGTKASALRAFLEARGARVAVPDLNAPDFSGLTLSRSLEKARNAIGEDGIWDVVGSSMGGLAAAFFAARHPQRVRKVALLCPAFHLDRLFAASLGETAMAEWKKTGVHEFVDADGRLTPVKWELMSDLAAYSGLPPVFHPTLVIHGVHDTTVPPSFSREFAATSGRVQLEEIDDDHRMADSVPLICERIFAFLTNG